METSHNSIFAAMVLSQKSHCMIDKFLVKAEPSLNFRSYELKDLFYQTAIELSLSEIEILTWLIFIDSIGIKESESNLKEFLILAGLQAKFKLGSDITKQMNCYKERTPEIAELFEVWGKQNSHHLNISTKQLGKKYRELSMPCDHVQVNYNFYINDVLGSCKIYQKRSIDEIFEFKLSQRKSIREGNIFDIKKTIQMTEEKEYDLNTFDRIDC
ncbi:hypothetical protein SteCoe_12632 [Stentor coeruleus]|uniref:Uncharacterized protein n=1 Tax=Stentor coeruleus TaxID=5963 RepID=A0A1R2CAA3_9CILI|nr:hypothetical protein SteCoe_12632 [Stentor coeruleus]